MVSRKKVSFFGFVLILIHARYGNYTLKMQINIEDLCNTGVNTLARAK